MRVTIPKNSALEEEFEAFLYKRANETSNTVTYEGVFPFGATRRALNLSRDEFPRFVQNIDIEGGYVDRKGDKIRIEPFHDRYVHFRISDGLYKLFKKKVKERDDTVSEWIRLLIREELSKWLGVPRTKERKKPESREEERMYG